MQDRKKRFISGYACICIFIFLIVGMTYVMSELSVSFADYINGNQAHHFRRFMAGISNAFDFSLFEALVFCIPIIVFLVIYRGMVAFQKGRGIRYIINLVATVLLIYSGHLLALGVGYRATDISEKMELPDVKVNEDKLTKVMTILIEEINGIADNLPRDENGVFEPGYSFEQISKEVSDSYGKLSCEYGLNENFDSRAKGFSNGAILSYLGITGIYTYYTGEANVNTSYPAYVRIFTTAHEMCHQRGILRENDANFVAYLITCTSDDEALRYSGALNMYSYFASALYKTNKETYYSLAETLCDSAKTDIRASNAVYEKYGDTIFEKISDMINNLYLKSNGTEGIISYSKVVELVVAYYQ